MDILPPVLPEKPRERRKSIGDIPYHHNLDLQQLFDTCRVCVFAIEQALHSSSQRPVVFRRLEEVDDTLKSIAAQFCSPPSSVSNRSSYLLILILQQVYESLRHYIETRCSPVSNVIEFSSDTGVVVLKMIPHGQVHVSIEKLAEKLDITDDEADQLEEFVYQLHRRIVRETRYTSPLERIVSATEMWTDQFVALSLYSFSRTKVHVPDSVRSALNNVREVLEMRDLQYSPLKNLPNVALLTQRMRFKPRSPPKVHSTSGETWNLAVMDSGKYFKFGPRIPGREAFMLVKSSGNHTIQISAVNAKPSSPSVGGIIQTL